MKQPQGHSLRQELPARRERCLGIRSLLSPPGGDLPILGVVWLIRLGQLSPTDLLQRVIHLAGWKDGCLGFPLPHAQQSEAIPSMKEDMSSSGKKMGLLVHRNLAQKSFSQ